MKRKAASQQWKILTALEVKPMTTKDLMPVLGLKYEGTLKHIRVLRKAKRIHICGHVRTLGGPQPLFMLGDRPDAEFTPCAVRKPKQPDRKTVRLQQTAEAFRVKAMTAADLAEVLHVSVGRARFYIAKLRAEKKAYIKSWRHPGGQGDLAPVYALGDKPDAFKPRESRASRYKREKNDPKRHDRILQKQRQRYHEAKQKPQPASWLSALGV